MCRITFSPRAGHDCYPRPGNVRSGWAGRKTCAGKDPAAAEARFRARLAEMGCTPLYEKWLGRNKPHRARCAAEHDCSPIPSSVMEGHGPCRICARRDKATAEAAFRARVAELGGTVLGEYQSANKKVHIRCPVGHDSYPRPADVANGVGMCHPCSGRDPAVGEAKFLARLRELGATPLYETWRGTERPHYVRCAAGHDCYPRPGNVRQGQGVCLTCVGQAHSAFYVLEHEVRPIVKFGITSREGRPRLARHRRRGFTKIHLLTTELPEGVARRAENAVKSALAVAGEKAVYGREYFDVSCLALIL